MKMQRRILKMLSDKNPITLREKIVLIVLCFILCLTVGFLGYEFYKSNNIPTSIDRNSIIYGSLMKGKWFYQTFVLHPDGTEIPTTLPNELGGEARWSSDGKWIVYSTRFSGFLLTTDLAINSFIRIMSSDGSQVFRLPTTQGSYEPHWSPSGKQIVYTQFGEGIFIVDVECIVQNIGCEPKPRALVIEKMDDPNPNWSPDGRFIAYSYEGHIFIIDSMGHDLPLDLTPDVSSFRSSQPEWSPDGTKIAFIGCGGICIFYQSTLNRLVDGTVLDLQWSPDGQKIAYIGNTGNILSCSFPDGPCYSTTAIFLIDSDGNNVTRISHRNDERIEWFTWHP
jgi:Tol biopolymer transport system component